MSLQIINIYHKEYPVDIKNQGRQFSANSYTALLKQ